MDNDFMFFGIMGAFIIYGVNYLFVNGRENSKRKA